MDPTPRREQGSAASSAVLVLLGLTFVLAALLAGEASRTERAQRRTAEQAMRDYAGFAAWQFARTTREGLTSSIGAVFRPLSPAQAQPGADSLPPPAILNQSNEHATACGCPVADTVHLYFRLEMDAHRVTTACGAPASLAHTRSTDSVTTHARSLPKDWDFATLFFHGGITPHVITYTVVRDARGEPVAAYGLKTPMRAYAGPIFRETLRDGMLLPRSLTRGARNDSLLSVVVTTRQGELVYRSPVQYASPFTAADTLDEKFGGLVVRVALRPEAAPRLLIGGLPRSRLPMWLGILTLTTVLLGLSMRLFWRERELARVREGFVARVSHELRTPLSEIRMYAEMLRLGRTRNESERRRSLEIIDHQAARLSWLVDNILHFSRGEVPGQRVEPEHTELSDEVRTIVAAFTPLAVSRRVELRLEVEEGVVAPVDRAALQQIILNLLDNAVKFGPTDQVVTVGLEQRGSTVRLWVDDKGPGIRPEDRQRIFEPYLRLHQDAERARGTGIGLAVVRELVVLHDGEVWVEEAPGGGARFVMELWRTQYVAPAPRRVRLAPARLAAAEEDAGVEAGVQ